MKASHFSKDAQEFLKLLSIHLVRYVIVGGEAVIYYGHARLTGDMDFFYDPAPENSRRLYAALQDFWRGNIPGIVSSQELSAKNLIVQFGLPPNRLDLLSQITAVSFAQAWKDKVVEKIKIGKNEHPVYYIGLKQLIKNKTAVKRHRDREDLEFLYKITPTRKKTH
jgi:predicted nucleotidyltransferase